MQIQYKSFNLELKNTFTINHGSRDFQPTLIIILSDGEFTGYGEAAATVYYGVTVEKMITSIKEVEPIIANNIHRSPEELWELTFPHLKENPFAQCALDMAMHDLHGKRNSMPLYKMWGLDIKDVPLTNYTIGMDTVDTMIRKIKEFHWPLYKIKLGTKDDIAIVKELRKHTNSVFRLDANAAWTLEQAIENSHAMKDLNVEFLEQPLKPEDVEGMKALYNRSELPLIADESCIVEGDVEKCAPYFHGVNIKLTKCAGITPGKRMIEKARSLNLKVMVGCMTESTVSMSAIGQLLPLLDYVDMDGSLLIRNDIAEGIKMDHGKVHFPDRNGTGVKLFNFE
ncbi:dipeptide epimerase [Gramella sp. MAR_2010_147]|uniref:dipeptide epimerase n=1 Tax=Gramella sp. MAR_2010_147 TaxID=1250205 RepID=UPI00087D575C|nr:dipeptide epimerase [Gramella sp. MAR_2010_147]SDS36388.1 L-alanine-DL-glutamate epimerase [Gramella sp. MAR_2010_147]